MGSAMSKTPDPKKPRQQRLGRSARRAETAAGRWPVADPEPRVIHLLRNLQHVLSSAQILEHKRIDALNEVTAIIRRWEKNESLDDLRDTLGLKGPLGRRRTQRTVNREFAIAFAYAEHRRHGGTSGSARASVAHEFAVSEREVDRADENWGPLVKSIMSVTTEHVGEHGRIDYSALKK